MLTFGESLYRTTTRDEETILLESYNRAASAFIAPASFSGSFEIPVQRDRCLYVDQVFFVGQAVALSNWTSFDLQLIDGLGNVLPTGLVVLGGTGCILHGDNAQVPAPAGAQVAINRTLKLVLPAGLSALRFGATRLVGTNGATFVGGLLGYLMPPGQITRA